MTAADNLALAADLARETAEYVSLTEQHTHTGRVFDYSAPLIRFPIRGAGSWVGVGVPISTRTRLPTTQGHDDV